MAESRYPYATSASNASHAHLFPAVEALLGSLPAGSRVLDLGCGNGVLLSRLRGRGWNLFGTDFSQTGIEIARKNFEGIHFFSTDIMAATAEEILSECGGPFDAVFSTEVIEHVLLPRTFVRLCFQVLKPGGRLVLTTPYHGYVNGPPPNRRWLRVTAGSRIDRLCGR